MAAPDAPALRGDDRDKISKAFERDAYGTRYSLTQYELSNMHTAIALVRRTVRRSYRYMYR